MSGPACIVLFISGQLQYKCTCIKSVNISITLRTCTCMPHAEVNLETVARGTSGFTGADLANLINQAALHGSAAGGEAVTSVDLEFAK